MRTGAHESAERRRTWIQVAEALGVTRQAVLKKHLRRACKRRVSDM